MNCAAGENFGNPPKQIAPQAKILETPPSQIGEFWDFWWVCARSARNFLGVFTPKNSIFNEIWEYLSKNLETPLAKLGGFPKNLETPPSELRRRRKFWKPPQTKLRRRRKFWKPPQANSEISFEKFRNPPTNISVIEV